MVKKLVSSDLTTADTKDLSSPEKVTFEDYIAEAEKAVAAFEGHGSK